MTHLIDTLRERGFIQQLTDEEGLRQVFSGERVTVYNGIDPTASSMHVGHLVPVMAMMHVERAGHRPVMVIGGGTAMVGDPSGRTELRQMLTRDEIQANASALERQLALLLDFAGGRSLCVNNIEWLDGLRYIEFLRDIGRHFSVNRMLSMEAYKLRLERGLSFIEFNYQLLQAYDFLELYRRYDCRVQTGGDDQWGNIIAGVDLTRRVAQGQVYGITYPLLLTATGEKMGKTAGGAVWLDPDRLSPYDYYQYWVNTHDDDVQKLLGFFTFLPMDEVREVQRLRDADLNAAKSVLAFEATKVAHGVDAASEAHGAAQSAFGGRQLPREILPSSDVPRAGGANAAAVPTLELAESELEAGVELAELLVRGKLCASKKEARRKLAEGAVRLGNTKPTDERLVVTAASLGELPVELRLGKKKVCRLVVA